MFRVVALDHCALHISSIAPHSHAPSTSAYSARPGSGKEVESGESPAYSMSSNCSTTPWRVLCTRRPPRRALKMKQSQRMQPDANECMPPAADEHCLFVVFLLDSVVSPRMHPKGARAVACINASWGPPTAACRYLQTGISSYPLVVPVPDSPWQHGSCCSVHTAMVVL